MATSRRHSTATSITSDDDYDVISASGLDSSIADLSVSQRALVSGSSPSHLQFPGAQSSSQYALLSEPAPSDDAKARFATATLSAEDVQLYVRKSLLARGVSEEQLDAFGKSGRMVRVYVDGAFDVIHAGTVHHLRQAKLAFPSVHLVVGVFPDIETTSESSSSSPPPLIGRAETLRHIRWVDTVIPACPRTPSLDFLATQSIDFVAMEEGASVDRAFDKPRLDAYEKLRDKGKVLPTRRTFGVVVSSVELIPRQGDDNHVLPENAQVGDMPTIGRAAGAAAASAARAQTPLIDIGDSTTNKSVGTTSTNSTGASTSTHDVQSSQDARASPADANADTSRDPPIPYYTRQVREVMQMHAASDAERTAAESGSEVGSETPRGTSVTLQRFEDGPPIDIYGIGI